MKLFKFALAVFGVFTISAVNINAASAASVTPTYVSGNPTCQSLGYQFGFKPNEGGNEDAPTGMHNVPGFGSITITEAANNKSVDWSATFGINAVIVKAGNGAFNYAYSPEAFADTNLQTPKNQNNQGNQANLSHLVFCYDTDPVVAQDPGLNAVVNACEPGSGENDTLTAEIENPNNAEVTYTVEVQGQVKQLVLGALSNGSVTFDGLTAGDVTVQVTGTDGTSASVDGVAITHCAENVDPCAQGVYNPDCDKDTCEYQNQYLVVACTDWTYEIYPCLRGQSTGLIIFYVTNNSIFPISYTAQFNGESKTQTIDAGMQGTFEFTGFASGTSYLAELSGNQIDISPLTIEVAACNTGGQGGGGPQQPNEDPEVPADTPEEVAELPEELPETGVGAIAFLPAGLASLVTYLTAHGARRVRALGRK